MIYWQVMVGLIGAVQVFKNMFGLNGRLWVAILSPVGLFFHWLGFHEFDPWKGLYTIAVAVLVYDFLICPALRAFHREKVKA